MNMYEQLEKEACEDGIEIIQCKFESDNIKGLYCDGTIAIQKDMTTVEKSCVLAEELGHHYTTVGNIVDLKNSQNRKQERQARLWAYNKHVGLLKLIKAYEHGCRTRHETAEFLEVTEQFLQESIDCYREKYGIGTCIDNYYISFIPYLAVGKIKI